MTEYLVPVRYNVDAHALVEADSPEEAGRKAVDGDFIDLYGYNDGELEISGDIEEWED
jgi:hypothetical protein